MLSRAARMSWLVVGVVALALGALGIALPLLPTTPFILVAAVAFARSSTRLHAWLVNHDVFGALIRNWQRHRAISRRAKLASILSMGAVLAISLAMQAPAAVVVAQLIVLGGAAAFILSRPEPPAPSVKRRE
ncbi:MAG TPA: YbaN family protein [Woeseiaceae bacterium]